MISWGSGLKKLKRLVFFPGKNHVQPNAHPTKKIGLSPQEVICHPDIPLSFEDAKHKLCLAICLFLSPGHDSSNINYYIISISSISTDLSLTSDTTQSRHFFPKLFLVQEKSPQIKEVKNQQIEHMSIQRNGFSCQNLTCNSG